MCLSKKKPINVNRPLPRSGIQDPEAVNRLDWSLTKIRRKQKQKHFPLSHKYWRRPYSINLTIQFPLLQYKGIFCLLRLWVSSTVQYLSWQWRYWPSVVSSYSYQQHNSVLLLGKEPDGQLTIWPLPITRMTSLLTGLSSWLGSGEKSRQEEFHLWYKGSPTGWYQHSRVGLKLLA